MDLTYSTEQTQLKDSVARFVADHGVQDAAQRPQELRPEVWQQMADFGWLGAGLLESEGGYGGGAVENLIILEELGKGVMPEPALPAMVAARLLASAQPDGTLLGDLLAGTALVLPALQDARGKACRLSWHGDAWLLSGCKTQVAYGDRAARLLVACEAADGEPALLALPTETSGVAIQGYRTMDSRRAANITFSQVQIATEQILAQGDAAGTVLQDAQETGVAALCAEATGVAAFLFDETLDYLKVRKQFGQPIGRFQALQHRMADLFVALEEARSLALMAAFKLQEQRSPARSHALSAAKLGVGARTMHIAREAVQLHGGMGMTEELPVGAGFRRVKVLQMLYGSASQHLARMARGAPPSARAVLEQDATA